MSAAAHSLDHLLYTAQLNSRHCFPGGSVSVCYFPYHAQLIVQPAAHIATPPWLLFITLVVGLTVHSVSLLLRLYIALSDQCVWGFVF